MDLVDELLGGTGDPLEADHIPPARAIRRAARRELERIAQEQALADVVKAPPKPGHTIHIISAAKFDFWTWAPTMLKWAEPAAALYCSTWTLNRNTAVELFDLWDAGKIAPRAVAFLTGLYFKRRETAVYATLVDGLLARGGRYRAFQNHAKILLLHNPARRLWLTVEGSANLTANPRAEQYAITNDRPLWEFYRTWFEEMLPKPKT